MSYAQLVQVRNVARLLLSLVAHRPENPAAVSATLTEWKVELSAGTIAAGTGTFTRPKGRRTPPSLRGQRQGVEAETNRIPPRADPTLNPPLQTGTSEGNF